jgi:hypothetical protein
MNLTEWVQVAAASVSYHCYILCYMNLTELVDIAAATVSYHVIPEYNNDNKL